MASEPIANYGMLSDCRSAALVSVAGSVDWLCFPRFDSPSFFGRVLGEDAGFWSIRPVAEHSSTRRYLGPTMVLETVHTTAGADVLALSTPVPFDLAGDAARTRLVLRAGDVLGFALHHQHTWQGEPSFWSQEDIARRLEDTLEGWGSWSRMHQKYVGPWQDLVATSGRVLQALTFYPTGAIVAAPTTSLPEVAGGTRNWDYRYTWIRDASMTLQALWVAACPDEAGKPPGAPHDHPPRSTAR